MTTSTTTEPPPLDEFVARAQEWLAANAELRPERVERVWGEGSDSVAVFHNMSFDDEKALDRRSPRAGSSARPTPGTRRSTGRPSSAARGCRPPTPGPSPARRARLPHAGLARGDGHHVGADRADDPRVGHPRADGAVPHQAAPHRGDVVPAVLRARRRLRPGPAVDAARCATATSGSSMARRCGPRAPATPTTATSSAAPTPTCPSTSGSPRSSCRCTPPASMCARCAR